MNVAKMISPQKIFCDLVAAFSSANSRLGRASPALRPGKENAYYDSSCKHFPLLKWSMLR
jgi:hypothetical protein